MYIENFFELRNIQLMLKLPGRGFSHGLTLIFTDFFFVINYASFQISEN